MEVAALIEFTNFGPLVFSNIVNLSLLRRVVRVFAANSINIVFSFELKSSVKMSKLVTTFAEAHWRASFHFVSLLIQEETIARYNSSDFIFL